ncbi:MAG: hypothetical protein H6556_07680 [Lewinellaceae bacterium]|nr:hypothetical protein [Lewinellaceae bacterium]
MYYVYILFETQQQEAPGIGAMTPGHPLAYSVPPAGQPPPQFFIQRIDSRNTDR